MVFNSLGVLLLCKYHCIDITNRIINPPEVMSLFILINTQRQRERTDNLYSFLLRKSRNTPWKSAIRTLDEVGLGWFGAVQG